MSIEVIINIAIVLFIIVTALKRVNDVSKKSEDIKKPPVRPPVPQRKNIAQAPPVRETARPAAQETWSAGGPSEPAPAPVHEQRSLIRELLEQAMNESRGASSPELRDEVFDETSQRRPIRKAPPDYEEPVTAAAMERAGVSHAAGSGQPSLELRFGRNAVTRGIIMSEILGPPAALREDRY